MLRTEKQTRQTDKQTASNVLPTPTDRVIVGNEDDEMNLGCENIKQSITDRVICMEGDQNPGSKGSRDKVGSRSEACLICRPGPPAHSIYKIHWICTNPIGLGAVDHS